MPIFPFSAAAEFVVVTGVLQHLGARLSQGCKDGRLPICPDGARPYHLKPATTKPASWSAEDVG